MIILKKSRYILLAAVLLAIDLISKYIFYDLGYFGNWIFIEKVFNLGISRGIALPFAVMVIVAILALLFFVWMYKKNHISGLVFALLLAGTLGNLIDRLWLGGVRDFISISNFPVFNFADIILNIAVFIFIFKEIKHK